MSDGLSPDDLNQNRGDTLEDLTGGEEEQEEATKRYTLDLPKSLHKWLKQQAIIEEERSMKEITIEALEQYREEHA